MPLSRHAVTLIGEEIGSPWNEAALTNCAQAFGGSYLTYDGAAETTDARAALSRFDCLIAAENTPGAESIYSYRPANAEAPALIVGNEAKGLRRRTRNRAHAVVQIPLPSRNINCLNVAAAAAVMLAYLSLDRPLPFKRRSLASIQKSRPGILLVGGPDHMELGSTVRSVCAFGWDRVLLDDRADAWYECDRRIKSEGRGAARRGRNPIRVAPYRAESLANYRKAIIFTALSDDRPNWQLPMIGGDVLLVLPDEACGGEPWRPPSGWRGEIAYAALPPVSPDRYHYRQMSAIALAEAARQLGEPESEGIYVKSRRDRYRREIIPDETAPRLDLEDLQIF